MKEEHDENFTSKAQEKIRRGNFKDLYNKKYGDIAGLTKQHHHTPEQVFDFAVRYFTWAEDNALKAAETASFQGIVTENLVHKVRVFTVTGFCLFAGLSSAVMTKWRREPGFSEVMEFIDSVISEQKFQLAANGIINASFIGKDIGIDKSAEINVNASSSSTASVTTEEVKAAVHNILGEL